MLILSLIVVSDKRKIFVLLFFVILIILIYLIQLYRPDLITKLNSESQRWADSLISAIYTSFLIFFIIRFLHRNYTAERLRAEKSEKELQRINEDKDIFISILAHDLKNPFTSIIGFLTLLKDNIDSYDIDMVKKQISMVHRSAENTYILLEDILTWGRANSGYILFDKKNIRLHDVCTEIIGNFELSAQRKDISIKCLVSNTLEVIADKYMLITIIRNLVSNAIKYTDVSGEIKIDAEIRENDIVIKISDNGVGIEADKLDKLFDITQIHSSSGTAAEKGTGLGLLLCKKFVDKHNGKICVESEVGKGSTFKFAIPK